MSGRLDNDFPSAFLNLFTSFLTQVDVRNLECSSHFLFEDLEGHRFNESLCPSFFKMSSRDCDDNDIELEESVFFFNSSVTRCDPGVANRIEMPKREERYKNYLYWAATPYELTTKLVTWPIRPKSIRHI